MSGQQVIASPAVAPVSAYVAPSGGQAPPKNSNTIILAIILIAIVVFCIFLFTKMNTINKQVKELQTDRDSLVKSMKLLEAIGEQVGIRQNEQGEIEQLTDETGDGEDEEPSGEECGGNDAECEETCGEECKETCKLRDACRRTDESVRAPPRMHPGMFAPGMFGQLFGTMAPGDVTIVQSGPVRASAQSIVEEAPAVPTQAPASMEQPPKVTADVD